MMNKTVMVMLSGVALLTGVFCRKRSKLNGGISIKWWCNTSRNATWHAVTDYTNATGLDFSFGSDSDGGQGDAQ